MAKLDFCFTFYDGDAARDMSHMDRTERGAYMDIIISQRKFGHLSKDQIIKILSKDFEATWGAIEAVLAVDEDGKFFIEWLENSLSKSRSHSVRQTENITKRYQEPTDPIPDATTSLPEVTKAVPKSTKPIPLEDGDGIGIKGGVGEKNKKFVPPTVEQVIQYFAENGYTEAAARKAHEHYRLNDWKDTENKPVKAWKQKMHTVWFQEKYKAPATKLLINGKPPKPHEDAKWDEEHGRWFVDQNDFFGVKPSMGNAGN